jgi:hypothetical protein
MGSLKRSSLVFPRRPRFSMATASRPTGAYDVVGVDRPEWDARIERGENVVREHCFRLACRERTASKLP